MRKPQIWPTKGIWKKYGISNTDSCTEVEYGKRSTATTKTKKAQTTKQKK